MENNTPTSIVNLRQDCLAFDEEQFRAQLGKLAGTKRKTKRESTRKAPVKKAKRAAPSDDRPSTRIVHVLRVSKSLSDEAATIKLEKALLKEGISADKISKRGRKKLENWIEELTENISSSVVMHAAMNV